MKNYQDPIYVTPYYLRFYTQIEKQYLQGRGEVELAPIQRYGWPVIMDGQWAFNKKAFLKFVNFKIEKFYHSYLY